MSSYRSHSPLASSCPDIPDHEVMRIIGRGSYGEVWLARSVMGTLRAVKVVHRAAFDHERPFEREFAGLQRYEPISRSHEGLVQVLHAGRATDGQSFYYVMELADNAAAPSEDYQPKTLRSLINDGPLPIAEVIRLGLALTAATGHLHRQGLVHRDLKPSNIIIVQERPKLADLGLVSAADDSRSVVGTEGFMPPEGAGSPAGDVFSLGRILYEMATGYDRHDFPALPPEWLASGADPTYVELNEVLLRACEPMAQARFATADEFHAELALIQAGKSIRKLRQMDRRWRWLKRAIPLAAAAALMLVGAWWLAQREATVAKEGRWQALVAQAQGERRSGLAEGRFLAMQAIREAVAIKPSDDLRDEAIACLALSGMRPAPHMTWRRTLYQRRCRTASPFHRAFVKDGQLFISTQHESLPEPNIDHLPAFQERPQLSGDGRYLALRGESDGLTRLYDVLNQRLVATAEHAGRLGQFSGNSEWFAEIQIQQGAPHFCAFACSTGQILSTIPLPEAVEEMALAHEAKKAVVRTKRKGPVVIDWSVTPPRLLRCDSDKHCHSLSLSADGNWATGASDDRQITVWATSTGQVHWQRSGHQDIVISTAHHPLEPIFATSSWDGTLRLWDITAGQQLCVMAESGEKLRFSADGRWIGYVTWDTEEIRWAELAPPRAISLLAVPHTMASASLYQLAFSADNQQIAAAAGMKGAFTWTIPSHSSAQRFTKAQSYAVWWDEGTNAFQTLPEPAAVHGQDRAALMLGHLAVTTQAAQPSMLPLPVHNQRLTHVSLSADARSVAAASFPTAGLWLWQRQADGTFPSEPKPLPVRSNTQPGFSPDGLWLVSGEADAVVFYDVLSEKIGLNLPRRNTAGHKGPLAFSPNGRWLAIAESRTVVRLFSYPEGRPLARLESPLTPMLQSLAFSSDGQTLAAAGNEGRILLWDLKAVQAVLRDLGLNWKD